MVWQDIVLFPGPHVDVEQEREARLAAQVRAGADWALSALIARYQPVVVRYLTRLTGDGARAATLAEHIFVRMERRLRGPHGAQHLRLWLLRASTEAGLDALRNPHRAQPPRLQGGPLPRGLLAERVSSRTSQRLRAGLGRFTGTPGSTNRQARPLIWSEPDEVLQDHQAHMAPPVDDELDRLDPREALRHRLVRAVLAELPYGDAQCLALHLIAGLNQSEVAQALGIRPSAARHRVVQGLQLFSHRYEAALASLGITADVAYDQPFADEEQPPRREDGLGEDLVIPRADYPEFDPEEGMMVVTDEMPAWPRPAQSEPAEMPREDMGEQPEMPTEVFADDASPETDADAVAAEEPLAEPSDEPAPEPVAIPVAESAIVGPIVDAVPVAADMYASAMNGFQEQDTQSLGYSILVEQPHVVEAKFPAEAPAEAMPVSWPDNEPPGETRPEAEARVVPILSTEGSAGAPERARAEEREANTMPDGSTRLIPVLSDGHGD